MIMQLLSLALLITYGIRTSESIAIWQKPMIENFDAISHKEAFDDWKATFNKSYSTLTEEGDRFLIWLDNWYKINQYNLAMDQTKHAYKLQMNQFSDFKPDEFKVHIHGSHESCLLTSISSTSNVHNQSMNTQTLKNKFNLTDVPDAWDWTNVNGSSWVTSVKDQKLCGSCWAFSAVGAIESGYLISNYYNNKTNFMPPKNIPALSEQQLIECSSTYGNMACNGGLMDNAFEYVMHTGGLCTEAEYPYMAPTVGECKQSSCGKLYDPITSYIDVSVEDEEALKVAVFKQPVSVAIEADQYAFKFYHNGILHGKCGDKIDHGVLLVGYGFDKELNMEYWKIKNSWSESWGENGFGRICRNCNQNGEDGECGILLQPSFPVAKQQ